MLVLVETKHVEAHVVVRQAALVGIHRSGASRGGESVYINRACSSVSEQECANPGEEDSA